MAVKMTDVLRFLTRLITNPLHTGALAPSGVALSRAMAAPVDPERKGPVLELGPGTGVVTRAILERGIAPERLTALEYNPEFATMVAGRYPGVRVIVGDAFDLETHLDGPKTGFAAVLSSMPLVNFPNGLREKLVADVFARLQPGAPFVQFSYRLGPPIAPPPGVTLTRAAVVWLNLPPARVWVYRKV
jgi:phosphatidylethanolamine/phosphatidyl-N-methylethanolamine N-methyltransferase